MSRFGAQYIQFITKNFSKHKFAESFYSKTLLPSVVHSTPGFISTVVIDKFTKQPTNYSNKLGLAKGWLW